MYELKILIIILSCQINKCISSCLFPQCDLSTETDGFYFIKCKGNQKITLPNETLNGYNIMLKLESISDLDIFIKNSLLDSIKLYSLDISNNQDTFENYFDFINSFVQLKILNLSYNKISMIRTRQFDKLFQLKKLDLSFNEIFYFEENTFLWRWFK